jgi:pilus assembly protein Flp/PilA
VWCDAARAAQSTHNAASPHNRTAAIGAHNPKGDVMQLVNFVKSFARNDEGQDLLEYALLVALIALVAVAAVTAAGSSVSTIFTSIAGKLVTPSS